MSSLGWIYDGFVSAPPAPAAEIVFIHGNAASITFPLQEAFPEARISVIYRPGSNSGYDEVNGLAKEFPTLDALCDSLGVGPAPLIVMAFSAGGWALRYYLRSPAARARIRAAAFLDSLYGAPNGKCELGPYLGAVDFGKMANAQPTQHRLYLTYSSANPEPGICAAAVDKSAGAGSGIIVKGYPGSHNDQQTVVGPAIAADVRPWLLSQPPAPPIGPSPAKPSETRSGVGWVPWAIGAAVVTALVAGR